MTGYVSLKIRPTVLRISRGNNADEPAEICGVIAESDGCMR